MGPDGFLGTAFLSFLLATRRSLNSGRYLSTGSSSFTPAFINKNYHSGGGDTLADGGDPEDIIRLHRHLRGDIGATDNLKVNYFVFISDKNDCTGKHTVIDKPLQQGGDRLESLRRRLRQARHGGNRACQAEYPSESFQTVQHIHFEKSPSERGRQDRALFDFLRQSDEEKSCHIAGNPGLLQIALPFLGVHQNLAFGQYVHCFLDRLRTFHGISHGDNNRP